MVEELLPGIHDLNGVDHLRVEARRDLNPHACREQHEVEITQVRLLVPWHQVMLNSVGEHWIRRTSGIFRTRTDSHVDYLVSNVMLSQKARRRGLELGQGWYTIVTLYHSPARCFAPISICTLHRLLKRALGVGGGEGPVSAWSKLYGLPRRLIDMLWAFAGQAVARWLAETAKCDPHPSWGPRMERRYEDARFRCHLDGARTVQ